MSRAFTLLELIVVVAIIGMIAGIGSVFVREYGEQRNATLTDRKSAAVVEGLMRTEKDGSVWYAEGFVADMGTFPPELSALHDASSDTMRLIHADESNATVKGTLLSRRLLMRDNNGTGSLLFPAPFLEDDGHDGNLIDFAEIALYGGYAGPYGPKSLEDAWGGAMEFNDTVAFTPVNGVLAGLRSAGADHRFDEEVSPLRDEFNEFADAQTEKAAYGEDSVEPLRHLSFRPASLAFDIVFEGDANETNRVDIVIYSPMLYFVEDTGCDFEKSGTTFKTVACDGGDPEWQLFGPDVTAPEDATYALGVAKYHFTLIDGDMNLSINGVDKPNIDTSAFMRASRVAFDTGTAWNIVPNDDTDTSFYLFGGAKSVVIFRDGDLTESFTWLFKPGRNEILCNRYQ